MNTQCETGALLSASTEIDQGWSERDVNVESRIPTQLTTDPRSPLDISESSPCLENVELHISRQERVNVLRKFYGSLITCL